MDMARVVIVAHAARVVIVDRLVVVMGMGEMNVGGGGGRERERAKRQGECRDEGQKSCAHGVSFDRYALPRNRARADVRPLRIGTSFLRTLLRPPLGEPRVVARLDLRVDPHPFG